jgi:hypothetical protein
MAGTIWPDFSCPSLLPLSQQAVTVPVVFANTSVALPASCLSIPAVIVLAFSSTISVSVEAAHLQEDVPVDRGFARP